ncbi:hypothetical protein SK128_004859 [Halocaridina rubra]|uniref:Uncharacterized protein n=1 Tax=Halocaridina rubra TaxID=373956 RepID=A0AAN9FX05_HALRR
MLQQIWHQMSFKPSLNRTQFCSNAHFLTDKNGTVDVGDSWSVGGSYEGVFPAGLLATLSSTPLEKRNVRLYRRDPLTPWKVKLSITAGHTVVTEQSKSLAEIEMERHLVTPGVQRIPIRTGRVRGALYIPPGPGPFPGIVDMFGSVGGLFEFRSAMLASRGFACLALAVFLYDDLPNTSEKLDFDYFQDAMKILLSHPKVIPDRCGVAGNSKNGDVIFNMGILFEQVKAVVGINAITFNMHTEFSYKDKVYAKGLEIPPESLFVDENGLMCTDISACFDNDLPHMIPVEKADDDTYFLIACGEDDACGFKHCPPPFIERMKAHGRKNYEIALYPGAGHILQPPYDPFLHNAFHRYLPTNAKYNGKPLTGGTIIKWGGNPISTCKAQVALWQHMQKFYIQHVRDESPWYQNYLQNPMQDSQNIKSHV